MPRPTRYALPSADARVPRSRSVGPDRRADCQCDRSARFGRVRERSSRRRSLASAPRPERSGPHALPRRPGQRVAAALGKPDQVLVLRLPTSWLHAPVVGRESEQLLSRASDLLRGISDCAPLRIVVLASTTTEHLRRTIRGEHAQSVQLPPAQVRRDALEDAAWWGPYADAADIVCRRLDGAQT